MEAILIKNNKNINLCVEKNQQKQFVILLTEPGKINLEINLAGENARAEILGVVLGHTEGEINLSTVQHHTAPNTTSNLLVKSVLTNASSLSFFGLIRIEKDAQKSNAYQRNDNILLSPQAKVNSKPYLEILANDVLCTHGATMGQIDKEQKFYLESRGLNSKESEELIVNGFLHSLLDKISNRVIVETVNKKLALLGYGAIS
ncbi:SufD family Fe-S cluster assembly protein [Candidatus Roizmanbacteria bacterium]|nr:SufD family Fe-S cluster assembly protein [Candidatus Roizmanbacteria bacterium]